MLKLTARLSGLLLVFALTVGVAAQPATTYPNPADRVLTHREQAPLVKGWIQKRFDTVLPQLMSRTGIDMWIIVSREYNDDPVFRSMAPLTTFSSRRRTILVFFNPGGGKPVERLSIGRFDYDGLFTVVQTHNDAQYEGLRKVVEERDPRRHRHQRVGRLESRRRADRQRKAPADRRARPEVLGPHRSPPRCSPSAGSRSSCRKSSTPIAT